MGKDTAKDKQAVLALLDDEYKQTVDSLKDDTKRFWEELERLQSQVREVTAENEALSARLSEAESLRVSSEPQASAGQQPQQPESQQLETLRKERDSAVQLWQSSLKEIERLEAALTSARAEDSDQRWRTYIEQVRSQYARAVSSLTSELARQREEAERAAADRQRAEEASRAAESAAGALRDQLRRLTARLREEQERQQEQEAGRQELAARLQRLESEAAAAEERRCRAAEEAAALRRDLTEARERCVQLSAREAETLDKLKEGVEVVQNALLEKEEAVQRAARLQGELAELEASLAALTDEAGLRTKQEVDAVREQCNRRLAELAETLQQRVADEVERQQQLDRLMREKKKVETEYDKLKAEHSRCGAGGAQLEALQELTERLVRLEQVKDQAERRAAELGRTLDSARQRHQIEEERAAEDAEDQQRRLSELSATCDDLLAQKRALTERLASVQAEHDAELAETTERRRQLEKTVSSLEQKLRQKERLLSSEIQSYETDHEHTKTELRQQLAKQQEMTAKWRRDLLTATEQHEQRLAEMRRVERDLARRITELEDELRDSRARETETAEEVKRYKYRVRELELRVQAAEKRFLTVRSGAARLAARRRAADPCAHLED